MAQNNIEQELTKILDQFKKEEQEKINKIYRSVASAAVRDLKARSPRRKGGGGGDYASGWKSKQEKTGLTGNKLSITVYNAKKPSLTHLLEKGHVVANQYGAPRRGKRRVAGQKHIATVEEKFSRELVRRLESEL